MGLRDAIRWWEEELTPENRKKMLPISWKEVGDVEDRHRILLNIYKCYHANHNH